MSHVCKIVPERRGPRASGGQVQVLLPTQRIRYVKTSSDGSYFKLEVFENKHNAEEKTDTLDSKQYPKKWRTGRNSCLVLPCAFFGGTQISILYLLIYFVFFSLL